jgi:hypothetical protein
MHRLSVRVSRGKLHGNRCVGIQRSLTLFGHTEEAGNDHLHESMLSCHAPRSSAWINRVYSDLDRHYHPEFSTVYYLQRLIYCNMSCNKVLI